MLIGDQQRVKISDFGTSREWNDVSAIMSFAGTLAWMAPEVIRNELCSEKVDIWSVIFIIIIIIIIIKKTLAAQGWEIAINTLLVRRPQPHNTNP